MSAPRLSAGGVVAGKYTVRSVLGDGGAVITYHCVNPQGQDVAVKLYDPAVASHSTVMKSLEQAYAATNALPQNSAAPIIDAGYDQPTLAPFSVTELIRLPSLAAQQRRLAPEEVVGLLKGLARSLDLAHVRNVVHGAIKPTNVFVGPNANPVLVTDFAANLPKAAIPTQEGFVSSAPWIAPEQAQSGSVTPAADVFSVGLLTFYALTGRSYWRSCQGQAFDLNGWQQELAGQRTPASARAAELGVPLSPTLDMVIWKAISNDPQERFKSIGEFQNVLEDSLIKQVGSAATMALPMVGDAPSPLPANMRNPEAPRPAAGMPAPQMAGAAAHPGMMAPANPHAAATMALTADQLMPPGQMPQPGYGNMNGPGMQGMNGGMNGPGMQQGMNGPGMQGMNGGMNGPGMNGPGMQQSGMNPAYGQGMPGAAPSQGGTYAFAQGGRDPGYPPPPQAITPKSSSKVLPIVIGFLAVALLGVVATLVVLKLRGEQTADDSPVTVPSATAAPTETATAAPAPSPTTPPEPSSTGSAATPPQEVDVKLVCKPACDEIKVDGKVIDPKKPLKLTVGAHEIEVSKAGYVGQTEKLDVKAGSTPQSKTFTLVQEKSAAPPPTNTVKPPTTGPVNTGKPPCKKGGLIKKC